MQATEKTSLPCFEHHFSDTNVGHNEEPAVIPSSSDDIVTSQPAKRPTRQWAAWTREEEESFFTALRQVGKNFEKITCRVQSKNKDQVRHYYYRLVRRMNKLLGPDLSLDAKNSKDTNAAMLRWWSLLEKYSCKASKLHLKPRRFKIFIEALEHQLTKDRKKNVNKRMPLGENYSPPSSTTTSNQIKLSGNDARAVKIVVVDSQNVQKAGQGRGSSARRNPNMGVIRSISKGESSHPKPPRQRRKTGAASAAAMKRWEKAAMAGVSLVADAAEHLERTAEQIDSGPSMQVQGNSPNLSKGIAVEDNLQPILKLKLQLFPIDESTRKALEMDKHNPHLELTLSSRKKISSILEHLDRKWGTSSVASGELMLFPFSIQRENLLGYQRWSRESVVTAAEVYSMIGSPLVFRLRYGWISSNELQSGSSQTISVASSHYSEQENRRNQTLMEQLCPPTEVEDKLEKLVDHMLSEHQTSDKQNSSLKESTAATSGEANKNSDIDFHNDAFEMQNLVSSVFSKRIEACVDSTLTNMKNVVGQRAIKNPSWSTREWADRVTNATAGKQSTEVSDVMDVDCNETHFKDTEHVEEIPFTCDSFDAAIAAHIISQSKIGFAGPSPHLSSIWDAEETCDAFSFQNRVVSNQVPTSASAAASIAGAGPFRTNLAGTSTKVQDSQDRMMAENDVLVDTINECRSDAHEIESSAKDFSSLTDIYWPDSLGPLELDVPSCKYYSEDLILSDSLSGLNRLLASSLDAFQNCSFFGLDEKRPPSPATGTQGGATFAGKIGPRDSAGVQSLQV
ncbi:hypothetical protein BVRB_7g161720 [Beta vulgaris subsp. vulgaris]|uniref:TSL-kinase interacting protein 1 n=1 Tax=Beta vulgaris subsp. vulgaris TaxID=3555 RepID=UPI00053FAFA0|nr:TSL-kinase interacting protein 1 [Beta vulgaris subsp. vulgaris]XP_010684065.1 TSL-kinase interacting protein 1 [Beta vulgaris subsp. vulgaris]KMT06246.1 hypothetical protein BVRB_7g161720 [Beta vulgaris subsp. vulgaris]